MSAKDQWAADMDAFLNSDEHGEDVLYNDGSGPVAIVGCVDFPGGDANIDQATIMVKRSDVPAPSYRQTFTIDSQVWRISAGKGKNFIVSRDDAAFVLSIRRGERFSQWQK